MTTFAVYLHPEVEQTTKPPDRIHFVGFGYHHFCDVRAEIVAALRDTHPSLPLRKATADDYATVHDRAYLDVIVQVADDEDFTQNVRTLFNNDNDNTAGLGKGKDMNYVETSEGKLVDAKGVKARFVRLYSAGNNANDLNHYVEVEVFGRPAK